MIMTPEEICRHYQQAKHPQQDIAVLADLNGTDKASIRAVLIDAGLCPPDQPDKGRSVRRGQYDDAIAALVSLGAEDKTIAAQVGCCVETVKKWRKRQERVAAPAAPVPPDAGDSLPPASEAVCKQLSEPRQTAGGDIYARLEAILSAVPANSSRSVLEQASDLLTSMFCEYISTRLGRAVTLHEQ